MTKILPGISQYVLGRSQFLVFLTLVLAVIAVSQPSVAYSETLEQRQTRLAAENLRDFEEWRANIPDYERRLYQRVKKLNDRTVNLMRVLAFGLIFTLALLLAVLWQLRRGVPTLGSIPGSAGASHEPAPSQGGPDSSLTVSKSRLASIEARQSKLAILLDKLERGVAAQSEELHAFNRERTDLERTLNDIKTLHNSISSELSKESTPEKKP